MDTAARFLRLEEIETRICRVTARHTGVPPGKIRPEMSFIGDLGIDSLSIVELVMDVEEEFGISLPEDSADPVLKKVFTRCLAVVQRRS